VGDDGAATLEQTVHDDAIRVTRKHEHRGARMKGSVKSELG
jgi:hypothetical protein